MIVWMRCSLPSLAVLVLGTLLGVVPAAAQAPVKITLWHAMGGARYDAITKEIAAGFNKESSHRALSDIRDSIAELTYYRQALLDPHVVQRGL